MRMVLAFTALALALAGLALRLTGYDVASLAVSCLSLVIGIPLAINLVVRARRYGW